MRSYFILVLVSCFVFAFNSVSMAASNGQEEIKETKQGTGISSKDRHSEKNLSNPSNSTLKLKRPVGRPRVEWEFAFNRPDILTVPPEQLTDQMYIDLAQYLNEKFPGRDWTKQILQSNWRNYQMGLLQAAAQLSSFYSENTHLYLISPGMDYLYDLMVLLHKENQPFLDRLHLLHVNEKSNKTSHFRDYLKAEGLFDANLFNGKKVVVLDNVYRPYLPVLLRDVFHADIENQVRFEYLSSSNALYPSTYGFLHHLVKLDSRASSNTITNEYLQRDVFPRFVEGVEVYRHIGKVWQPVLNLELNQRVLDKKQISLALMRDMVAFAENEKVNQIFMENVRDFTQLKMQIQTGVGKEDLKEKIFEDALNRGGHLAAASFDFYDRSQHQKVKPKLTMAELALPIYFKNKSGMDLAFAFSNYDMAKVELQKSEDSQGPIKQEGGEISQKGEEWIDPRIQDYQLNPVLWIKNLVKVKNKTDSFERLLNDVAKNPEEFENFLKLIERNLPSQHLPPQFKEMVISAALKQENEDFIASLINKKGSYFFSGVGVVTVKNILSSHSDLAYSEKIHSAFLTTVLPGLIENLQEIERPFSEEADRILNQEAAKLDILQWYFDLYVQFLIHLNKKIDTEVPGERAIKMANLKSQITELLLFQFSLLRANRSFYFNYFDIHFEKILKHGEPVTLVKNLKEHADYFKKELIKFPWAKALLQKGQPALLAVFIKEAFSHEDIFNHLYLVDIVLNRVDENNRELLVYLAESIFIQSNPKSMRHLKIALRKAAEFELADIYIRGALRHQEILKDAEIKEQLKALVLSGGEANQDAFVKYFLMEPVSVLANDVTLEFIQSLEARELEIFARHPLMKKFHHQNTQLMNLVVAKAELNTEDILLKQIFPQLEEVIGAKLPILKKALGIEKSKRLDWLNRAFGIADKGGDWNQLPVDQKPAKQILNQPSGNLSAPGPTKDEDDAATRVFDATALEQLNEPLKPSDRVHWNKREYRVKEMSRAEELFIEYTLEPLDLEASGKGSVTLLMAKNYSDGSENLILQEKSVLSKGIHSPLVTAKYIGSGKRFLLKQRIEGIDGEEALREYKQGLSTNRTIIEFLFDRMRTAKNTMGLTDIKPINFVYNGQLWVLTGIGPIEEALTPRKYRAEFNRITEDNKKPSGGIAHLLAAKVERNPQVRVSCEIFFNQEH